jgi:hypothetical protein
MRPSLLFAPQNECPTELGGEETQQPMLRQIATVLRNSGFEVVYDP